MICENDHYIISVTIADEKIGQLVILLPLTATIDVVSRWKDSLRKIY